MVKNVSFFFVSFFFLQVPGLTIWYGPDTYMGENLHNMLTELSEMTDGQIRAVHPQHNRVRLIDLSTYQLIDLSINITGGQIFLEVKYRFSFCFFCTIRACTTSNQKSEVSKKTTKLLLKKTAKARVGFSPPFLFFVLHARRNKAVFGLKKTIGPPQY